MNRCLTVTTLGSNKCGAQRARVGEAAHECLKRIDLSARACQLGKRLLMFVGVNKLNLAVLANSDTGLRGLDPSAANALQSFT